MGHSDPQTACSANLPASACQHLQSSKVTLRSESSSRRGDENGFGASGPTSFPPLCAQAPSCRTRKEEVARGKEQPCPTHPGGALAEIRSTTRVGSAVTLSSPSVTIIPPSLRQWSSKVKTPGPGLKALLSNTYSHSSAEIIQSHGFTASSTCRQPLNWQLPPALLP